MLDTRIQFSLSGGKYYVTERENDAFRIKSGTVLVYIVPVKKERPGRRSFIYEATAGEVLPSFCHRDIDYREWRFLFVAMEAAVIEVIENGATKFLKEKFAQKAKIKNYKVEGYNGGLVDQYRINIVTEDSFIRRTQKQRKSTSEDILGAIYDSFYEERMELETERTSNALYNSLAVICAKQHIQIAPVEKIKEACGEYYGVNDIARISNFAYREVILYPNWRKDDLGILLLYGEKDEPYVGIPKSSGGYLLYDPVHGSLTPVSKKVEAGLKVKGYMVYRSLPSKEVKAKDIVRFCMDSIRVSDIVWLLVLTVITSLVGLLTPTISQKLYDAYIPLGAKMVLFQLGCVMASFMLANVMFSIVKNLVNFRITSRMSYDFQGAIYNRLFSLPESFFRKYESADLAQRVMGAGAVVNAFATVAFNAMVAMVFVIIYFCRMLSYSKKLTLIGLLMIAVYSLLFYVIAISAMKHRKRSVELEGKTSSIMYQFLNGISKIRIAGVEDRALYEYMKPYIKLRESEEKCEKINDYSVVLSLIANSVFSLVLYIVVIKANQDISLGSFIAFNTVFGSFTAYILQLVEGGITIKNLKPEMERLQPVLKELPEYDEGKEMPGEISGEIEISNVSFAYSADAPLVLQNVDLTIKPGEYVGLVGPSGCGKSTLMKLLLGFEKPTSGKIYYDNKDIESVDKRELRKKMGVVLQDGKLISGSIFENITITAPKATLTDVKKVVKAVGLENDINEMPMGLHTVLSEDCGTISGGQQQRILIARAIISEPNILFFDEATSALDNVTQSMVCETLEQMNSTRIVIAHRLSTIIKCDRIIVMDGGKIVEQGNYEELMANKGLFYQLASRQMA